MSRGPASARARRCLGGPARQLAPGASRLGRRARAGVEGSAPGTWAQPCLGTVPRPQAAPALGAGAPLLGPGLASRSAASPKGQAEAAPGATPRDGVQAGWDALQGAGRHPRALGLGAVARLEWLLAVALALPAGERSLAAGLRAWVQGGRCPGSAHAPHAALPAVAAGDRVFVRTMARRRTGSAAWAPRARRARPAAGHCRSTAPARSPQGGTAP